MPRGRGKTKAGVAQEPYNIETHPYNKLIIPQLRVVKWQIDFLRDNMPAPELLEKPIHGWTHLLHMLVYASLFCNYSAFHLEVVKWAILTHDCGRYHDDLQESLHPSMSAHLARIMIAKGVNVDADKVSSIVARHSQTNDAYCNEEAVLRASDRLDLWRLPNFKGIDEKLVTAPGWRKVEVMAKHLRLQGRMPDE